MLTGNRHPETEHVFARLGLKGLSVYVQSHFRLIGVDLDFRDRLCTVNIPTTRDVDKGLFLVPVRLVEIESVLFGLPVKGHQALLVLAVLAALIPSIGGEVENVPDVGRPQPGALLDHTQNVLMVHSLIALGIVALFRIRRLILGIGIGTILAETNAAIRILRVILVKKLVILFQFPQVPAKVQIVAVHVGDFQNGAVDLQHEYIGHGGGAGAVQLMAQVIQRPVVFQQFLIHRTCGGNLIGKTPYRNGRVIVVLHHQLLHLGKGVGTAICHVHGNVRDFRPDHHTVLVAEVIKLLRVLIMGKAQGIAAHLTDDFHIPPVVLHGQGVTHALAVLMPGAAPQGIAPSVQNKALLGIYLEFAAAKAGRHPVAAGQGGCCRIQIGIVDTVPQVNMLHIKRSLCITLHAGNSDRLTCRFHCNRIRFCLPGFHSDHSVLFFQIHHRGDLDAWGSAIAKRKMGSGYHNQVHAPVQSAVEGKVCLLGVYAIIVRVVQAYNQRVILLQILQLDPEGTIAALMAANLLAIEHHFTGVSGAQEL